MDKLLHSFVTIEKSIQIATLVGLMLFLGYLGFMNSRSDRASSRRHAAEAYDADCFVVDIEEIKVVCGKG